MKPPEKKPVFDDPDAPPSAEETALAESLHIRGRARAHLHHEAGFGERARERLGISDVRNLDNDAFGQAGLDRALRPQHRQTGAPQQEDSSDRIDGSKIVVRSDRHDFGRTGMGEVDGPGWPQSFELRLQF